MTCGTAFLQGATSKALTLDSYLSDVCLPSISSGFCLEGPTGFPADWQTFPDEHYDYDAMKDSSVFVGAYEGEQCVGLAVLQPGFFRYMYLYDLKVNKAFRGRQTGRMLIDRCREIALAQGYLGLYTQGQDNNLGACLFYLHTGFYIGGFDSNVYKGTKQEGKADIIFYLDG